MPHQTPNGSCDHLPPFCEIIRTDVISRKPKRNGMVRVVRYCDCCFCGPHEVLEEIGPIFDSAGKMLRNWLSEPLHKIGEPLNVKRP